MARIRTIKPEFFVSQQVVECSTNARLLFVGLWCFSDDRGVHPATPKTAKMEVFPGDDFTVAEITSMIDELKLQGLLREFEVPVDSSQPFAGHRFWSITGWHHQRIDKPNPKYPDPRLFLEHSTSIPRLLATEGKGRESNGREGSILGGTPKPPKRARFVEPTLQEVSAYCRERNNGIDADQFVDFYMANGWTQGKGKPIRNWQAAVRTWEKNGHNGSSPATKTPAQLALERFGDDEK